MRKKSLLILSFILITKTFLGNTYIGFVYPAGGQIGTSFDVIVGGQELSGVKGVYISGKGIHGEIVTILPSAKQSRSKQVADQDNKQISERVKIRITIDDKAEPGIRDFRLVMEEGYSNRIFFDVDELPEQLETEPNDQINKANILEKQPVLVNGQIMPGDRDCFRFQADKGQTIVCETKARKLVPYLADAVPGWFQAVLSLTNSDGREVAYNDDFLLHPDPVIIFEIPESGEYTLQIKDAIFRGRESFVYRISIGEIPFVRSIFPLGGQAGTKQNIYINGVNLKTDNTSVQLKKEKPGKINISAKGTNGLTSNLLPFHVSDMTEIFEKESNNSKATAEIIKKGQLVNGKINSPTDEDWFRFTVPAKSNVLVEIKSRRLRSPLDAELTLFDQQGNILGQNDDFPDPAEGLATHHADPRIIRKIPSGGTCFIRLRDIQGHGGDEFGYRLILDTPKPDFDLRIDPSNLLIYRGGTTSFTVHALRKNNFKGKIELELKNLPKGVIYSHNVIPAGENQLRITLTAPPNLQKGRLELVITGKAKFQGGTVEKVAKPAEELMQAFIYLHLVPANDFLAIVVGAQKFSLLFDEGFSSATIKNEEKISVKVKLNRSSDFNLPVRLMLDKPPKGIRMKPVIVNPGEQEAELTIEAFNPKPGKKHSIVIKGVSRIGKRKRAKLITAISPAFQLEIQNYQPEKRKR